MKRFIKTAVSWADRSWKVTFILHPAALWGTGATHAYADHAPVESGRRYPGARDVALPAHDTALCTPSTCFQVQITLANERAKSLSVLIQCAVRSQQAHWSRSCTRRHCSSCAIACMALSEYWPWVRGWRSAYHNNCGWCAAFRCL